MGYRNTKRVIANTNTFDCNNRHTYLMHVKLLNKFSIAIFCAFLLGIFSPNTVLSTATPIIPGQNSDTTQTLIQFVHEHEKTFDPSKYPVPISIQLPKTDSVAQIAIVDSVKIDSLEYSTGYRVQVITTQDLDEANKLKDSLETLLPTEWTYIVYHAPFYKVRVGNFYDRSSANRMVRTLTEKGIPDTWVVPDEIVKNPPIKLPPVRMPVDTMMQH